MESNNLTVADVVEDTVDRLPTKTAIIFVNDGSRTTYLELDRGAAWMHVLYHPSFYHVRLSVLCVLPGNP